MNLQLTPQKLSPVANASPSTHALDVDDIQGDILVGLQKMVEQFVFFTISNVADFKERLKALIPDVTTTRVVIEREHELAHRKAEGKTDILPLIGMNVGFTQTGINQLLGAPQPMGDGSFQAGAAASAPALNDPVDAANHLTTWLAVFLGPIDGAFLVTGGTQSAITHQITHMTSILGSSWTIVSSQLGQVRPGAEKGHEHFGWQDGVSQPAVQGLSTPFPGQTLLEPGLFVFGYPQDSTGVVPPLAQPWMGNGSFMAFRRLEQLVPEFSEFILSASAAIDWDPVLIGARLVGRWKSGAPIALTPAQDDLSVAANPDQNNNFDFSDDKQEHRCPFSAHIRKSNPRADLATLPPAALNSRRIIRQGIPFGPEVATSEAAAKTTSQSRGLLFVCYQTSIVGQFEFVQSSWINNPNFVSPAAAQMPPGAVPPVTVGIDPIMGQPVSPNTNRDPQGLKTGYPAGLDSATTPGNSLAMTQLFIKPTGGAYLFMPSITALRHNLT